MTATIDAVREIPASARRGELKNFIGGKWVAAQTSEYLDVPNPATEEVLARVPMSSAADVDAAVKAARSAFLDWSELAVPERANYMFLFREALNDYREELTRLCTTENGKVYSDSAGEVRRGIEVVDFACGMPTLMMGTNLDQISKGIDSEMVRFPVGVCAGITPFNFPFMVPLWMYPIALAAGNTFILKPSERTPLSSVRTIEILAEIGLPPGVINIVHGGADAVTELCSHPGIDAVSFVGSARVAKIVYETSAKHGKRVQALGGAKNHIIVMPDAVLEPSIANITESAFGNAGQRCLAGSVMTVVGKARDEFLPRFVENADHLRMGFGLDEDVDLGPVIRDDSRRRILGYSSAACPTVRACCATDAMEPLRRAISWGPPSWRSTRPQRWHATSCSAQSSRCSRPIRSRPRSSSCAPRTSTATRARSSPRRARPPASSSGDRPRECWG